MSAGESIQVTLMSCESVGAIRIWHCQIIIMVILISVSSGPIMDGLILRVLMCPALGRQVSSEDDHMAIVLLVVTNYATCGLV